MNDIFQEYQRYIKELSLSEVSSLSPTNYAYARQEFLNLGTLRTPRFIYQGKQYSKTQLETTVNELKRIQAEVLHHTYLNANEKNLLCQIIQYRLNQVYLLQAADDFRTDAQNEAAKERFMACNEARYGKPDLEITQYLLWREINRIESSRINTEDDHIYQRLIRKLPKEQIRITDKLYTPSSKVITKFGQVIRHYLAPLFQHLPTKDKDYIFTAEEVVDIINQTLDQEFRPWSKTQYVAKVDEYKTNINFIPSSQLFQIPYNCTKGHYTREFVESTILGSEMIRLFRAIPYEGCGILDFTTGYLDYAEAEFGIISACELALRGGEYVLPGINSYITAGLAYHYGKYGFDFKRLFEIRRDMLYLLKTKPTDSPESKAHQLDSAAHEAFSEVTCATRGTSVLPYHRNLIYLRGNQQIWQYIAQKVTGSQSDIDELVHKFFWCGRTNPLNPQHLAVADDTSNSLYGAYSHVPWTTN